MKKERGLVSFILISFIFLYSINLVYAACPANQVIMRLSDGTNAHGELYSQSNYDTEICWNKPLISLAACTAGDGLVLRLSGVTNAHAEEPSLANYGTKICFENMVCTQRSACASNERFVVALSSLTNAHLSNVSTDPNYAFRICCKMNSGVSSLEWGNMNNEVITSAVLKDSVRAVIHGDNLAGATITVRIRKIGTILDDSMKNISFTSVNDNTAIALWPEAGKDEIDDGILDPDVPHYNDGEDYDYKFNVEINGKDFGDSLNLRVNRTGLNPPPTANIISPKDRGIYFLRENLLFNMTYSDPNDYQLNWTWDLGDGTIIKGGTDGVNEINRSFIYNYTSKGQKGITLTVDDNGGGVTKARISILIINSSFSFASISYPAWGQGVTEDNVNFNANTSFAINVSDSLPYIINCLGGACPSQTDGCPPSMTPGCHIAINGGGEAPNFDNLNFDWSFKNGERIIRTGAQSGYNVNSNFAYGNHWANLTVNKASGAFTYPGTTYVEFFVSASGPSCEQLENDATWTETNGAQSSILNDPNYNCFREDGVPTSNCCPGGSMCNSQTGECSSDVVPDSCTMYLTEAACNSYNPIVAYGDAKLLFEHQWPDADCEIKTAVLFNGTTYYIKDCRCSWTGVKCLGNYSLKKGDGTIYGSCIGPSVSEESNCSSLGYKTITWDATWTGTTSTPCPNGNSDCVPGDEICSNSKCIPVACAPGTDEAPCLSEAILGFFGTFGIALTLAAFVMFYFARIIRGRGKIK